MKKLLSIVACLLAIFCLTDCSPSRSFSKEIGRFRDEKRHSLVTDARAPLKREDLENLRFFEPSRAWRVVARFEKAADSTAFEMPTYSKKSKKFARFGDLFFRLDGRDLRLSVYKNLQLAGQGNYRNHLFLPFMDETTGQETYAGGRYIDLETTDIREGRVVVDFNRAYNPWCAYADGFNCPIPPAENRLPIAVRAGEMNYAGKH